MLVSYLFVLFVLINTVVYGGKTGKSVSDDIAWYSKKLASNETGIFDSSKVHVLRLGPREDLLDSLWRYARVTKIKAASIVSVVGSLTKTNIRYANQEDGVSLNGHFEIVSVVGNLDFQKTTESYYEGSGHVHMSFSDEKGVTTGGHVLDGNIIYTTAEITLLEVNHALFDRVLDDKEGGSGYFELQVFPEEH
jgi:predicted DNA-binding protein with PD1-like motif